MKRISSFVFNNSNFIKFFNLQSISIFLTIVLGKFIAIHFRPENFGDYAIISAIVAFFAASIVSPLIQSYRFLFNSTNYIELNNYFISGFVYIFLLAIPIIMLFSYYFELSQLMILLICATLICQTFQAIFAAGLNLKGKNNYYALIQVLLPFSNIILLLIAVFIFDYESYITLLSGVLFAQVVGLIMYFTSLKEHNDIRLLMPSKVVNDEKIKTIKRFIRPLLLLPVFSWLVVSGDKFLIKYFLDSHAVGIYAASYSIGSKVFISISSVLILWTNSSTYSKVNENVNVTELIVLVKKRLKQYFYAGILMVFVIWIFSGLIGKILLSNQYAEGFYLIGPLAFSSLIMTCYYFWEQAIYALGITKVITMHYLFGGILNFGLNIILIPLYGILGAAIAILVSSSVQYFILVSLFEFYTKKLTPLKY